MEIKVKLEEKSLRLSYAFSPVLLNQNSNLEIPSSSFGLQNFKALLIFVSISITYVACSQPEMPVLRHHRSYLLTVNTKCRHLGPPPPPLVPYGLGAPKIHLASPQAQCLRKAGGRHPMFPDS